MILPDVEDEWERRRQFARRPVRLPATLRVGGTAVRAMTENISPGGALLHVRLPPTVKELVASFQLPHGKDLHVRAKVRWRRPEPPGVGISFETFLYNAGDPDPEPQAR